MYQAETTVDAGTHRNRRRWVGRIVPLALLVGIILGGAALLVIWLAVLRPSLSHDEYRPANPPVPLPASYHETVEEQIAQGLGLARQQIDAEIAAHPDEGLFGVATVQGDSPDQLYAIELAALQAASDEMMTTGQWTQAQDDATMRYWRARGEKALGADMTDWFLHH